MRKTIILWVLCVFIFSAAGAQIKLSPEHQDWLDSVAPIITKVERDVFLQLKTVAEREKFIKFFWKQRDPLPDTSENEFQKDYMQRITFADKYFGIGTSKKGSRTERGYYYLLLGPPLERHFYTTQSEIWPLELWFYRGEEQFGLPPYFYLIFYQPQGMGEYRLYSPGLEGPEKLVIPSMVDRSVTRDSAFQTIRGINTELGGASLSYIPGERPLTAASFSSDNVVANVRGLPEKKYPDAYARSFLAYKDYVETDYSHNYIDCDAQVRVFEQDRQFFVHWTLEPSKMNFDTVDKTVYASYELVLKLEKPDGTPLLEKTEEIPLRLTPEQYRAHERQRFAFQDILPLAPGEARLFLLLKNKTSRDFMSFQAKLSVPESPRSGQLGDILLYHLREDVPEAQRKNLQAFSLDGRRYSVNARNEFLPQEKLGLYVQAFRAAEDPAAGSRTVLLEVQALGRNPSASAAAKPPVPAISRKFALKDVLVGANGGIDLDPFPLIGLTPGYYVVSISLLEANGRTLVSRKENFILLATAAPALPWSYARMRPPFPDSEQLFLLSTQYFLGGNFGKAVELTDKSLGIRDDPRARLLKGRALYGLGKFAESIAAVEPVYRARQDRDAAKIMALDRSSLGQWAEAVRLCDELLRDSTEVSVLNRAGEGYVRLDQPDKALPLLKKSLELVPGQPAIKALLDKAEKAIKAIK
jgi:GWxTD domain-containing protein